MQLMANALSNLKYIGKYTKGFSKSIMICNKIPLFKVKN